MKIKFKSEDFNLSKLFILSSKTVIFFMVFLAILFSVTIYQELSSASVGINLYEKTPFVIGESRLFVEIADDYLSRKKGLSERDSLKYGEGLLFIFDEPGKHGIWMKEMKFSIDIIWLDEYFQVSTIKMDATPESFPETFYPSRDSLYVLEVPAGFVKKEGIKIRDQATLFK